MNKKNIIIKGEHVKDIINLLDDDIKSYTYKPAENIYVFYNEKYYFRNNSELMLSLIVNIQEQNICFMNIIAGGGSSGFCSLDLGAEEDILEKIVCNIEQICENKNWVLEFN